jgi:predicted nuclease of predicted toxin-antitoxin system
MDEHVPNAITESLRLRGIDVLTVQEDNHRNTDDDILIDRATELGRLVFSADPDMLRHATRRQRSGIPFNGVIHADFSEVSIGQCVRDLDLICGIGSQEDFAARVFHLPLR